MAAYTFRNVGSRAANTNGASLAPGMPSGWQIGDLLILATCARGASETLSDPAGWTSVATYGSSGSLKVYVRVAESGDSAPNVNWSGSTASYARIAAFSGDVYTDESTILSTTPQYDSANNNTVGWAALNLGGVNDLFVMRFAKKNKTTTSNGISFAAESGWTELDDYSDTSSGGIAVIWDYQQQTTSASISQNNWTASGASFETLSWSSAILALKTSAAAVILKLKALVNSSAASAQEVSGVVFEAPTGGDLVGTKIGEFTDATFESSDALEDGKAVLKIPVSDFGGEALTTSDTPVAVIRNPVYTTGIIPCTVIEE